MVSPDTLALSAFFARVIPNEYPNLSALARTLDLNKQFVYDVHKGIIRLGHTGEGRRFPVREDERYQRLDAFFRGRGHSGFLDIVHRLHNNDPKHEFKTTELSTESQMILTFVGNGHKVLPDSIRTIFDMTGRAGCFEEKMLCVMIEHRIPITHRSLHALETLSKTAAPVDKT